MKTNIDLHNTGHVKALIERVNGMIQIHIKSWEKANDSQYSESTRSQMEKRSDDYAAKVEKELEPLGIKCYWPGLFPVYSFIIDGNIYSEHTLVWALKRISGASWEINEVI